MAINYFISKIKLQGKPKYTGRVLSKGTCNRDMVISRMLEKGTSLGKEDIAGVISLLEKTVYDMCIEGNKVNLDGFMLFTPAISGTFDGEADFFNKSRNEVYITAHMSSAYNNTFSNEAGVEKVMANEKKPYLFEVIDNDSGETNNLVTRNNIVIIQGEKLKFDNKDIDEYLRFVNAANPTEHTAISKCQKIMNKEIVFLMPAVAYSKGYFEIGSKMGTSSVKVGKSQTVNVK